MILFFGTLKPDRSTKAYYSFPIYTIKLSKDKQPDQPRTPAPFYPFVLLKVLSR